MTTLTQHGMSSDLHMIIGQKSTAKDHMRLGIALGRAGGSVRLGAARRYAVEKISSYMAAPVLHRVYDRLGADGRETEASSSKAVSTRRPDVSRYNRDPRQTSMLQRQIGGLNDPGGAGVFSLKTWAGNPIDRGR